MAEIGIVIKKTSDYVTVKLERKEACAKCRACTAGLSSQDMIIEAENKCGAELGDHVAISLEQSNFLQAVFIMYTVPLIFFFIGLGVGYLLGSMLPTITELVALGSGVIFLAIAFFIIRANEARWKSKKFRPVAEEIKNL